MRPASERTERFENTLPGLRRFWHPVARADDLLGDGPLAVQLLGDRWAVVRLRGELVALRDRCPHRSVPLSAGCVVDDTVQCPYHGYRFDRRGTCVEIPALAARATIPPKARVDVASAVTERYGLLWLAPDEPVAPIIDIPSGTPTVSMHGTSRPARSR